MNSRTPLVVASIVLSSTLAWAAEADCPRPDLWDHYPQISREVDHGLAEMKNRLTALEPEAFFAKHPALAKMAQSTDWAERVRALKAIAALEDPTGIPLLVAGITDAKDQKSLYEAMHPLTTWIATRSPKDRFKPLAPLFLTILVKTPDWPSVRCLCLQALGNLADRNWLPIIRELLVSRHPAVTNMSTWVIQQVSSRPGDDTRSPAAQADSGAIDLVLCVTYKPSEKELAAIVEKIKRLIRSPPANCDDDRIFYAGGIAWHDDWIPMSPSPQDKRPDVNFLRTWRYRNGRVCSVTITEPGKPPWVDHRTWYNSRGAPILAVHYHFSSRPSYFQWGDYDRDGLLRRIVNLKAGYSLVSTHVHDNGPKYCRTVIRKFDARGKLRSITRYADNKVVYTDVARDKAPKVLNHGHRINFICHMEDWGLAPFYPIPTGPMKVGPTDPPGSMLRIISVKVQPAGVEQQCRAKVVIGNGGVGYQTPPTVVGDDIVIRIFDSRGRLIFRAGHGWGGLEPGELLCLKTDTHSNTLQAAGGKPFLFPKAGRYTLSITARRGYNGKWTDSKSVTFYVGSDESEFKVLD